MEMRVYQDAVGGWIFFDGVTKHTNLAEQEAYQMAREAEFVEEAKAANRAVWEGIHKLISLQAEWQALDYGTTLDPHQGVGPTEVGAVVFATADALKGVLNAGHATNMAKLL